MCPFLGAHEARGFVLLLLLIFTEGHEGNEGIYIVLFRASFASFASVDSVPVRMQGGFLQKITKETKAACAEDPLMESPALLVRLR